VPHPHMVALRLHLAPSSSYTPGSALGHSQVAAPSSVVIDASDEPSVLRALGAALGVVAPPQQHGESAGGGVVEALVWDADFEEWRVFEDLEELAQLGAAPPAGFGVQVGLVPGAVVHGPAAAAAASPAEPSPPPLGPVPADGRPAEGAAAAHELSAVAAEQLLQAVQAEAAHEEGEELSAMLGGESKRPAVASPWSQLTGECQRF
jgi:hypothetical protein